MNVARYLLLMTCLTGIISPAVAYEHDDSLVNFEEYAENIVTDTRRENLPYFLLFSAEWCHWCHEFAKNTLVRTDVADYLNHHFVNIFIDVDVHNSAYVKYRATGLPYTVFLNPDGSIYYKYTGTLYGDDFLDVIKEVAAEVGVGKYALGMESSHANYEPPTNLEVQGVETMMELFLQGVLDNFDQKEFGLGKGQKAIQPRTFLYLLDKSDADIKEQSVQWIGKTLERAIDHIYDPVEGGFFRYAETRNWQIPHYEKFADLNAGAVLLLYKLDRLLPSPKLKQAAETTLAYLNTTLFDDESGAYLSFQIADTSYYFLSEKYRKTTPGPKVMEKIFTGRLAATLSYLVQLTEYTEDSLLEQRIRRSINFLAEMVMRDKGMNRYYALDSRRWFSQSGLSDLAYVASLFADAASRYEDPRYTAVAIKVIRSAITQFYDAEKGILVDPGVENSSNVEYLMEMNGLIAKAMVELGGHLDTGGDEIVESMISYFSLMTEVLEDRFWDAVDWDFTEFYVPYLRALEVFSSTRPLPSLSYSSSKNVIHSASLSTNITEIFPENNLR